MARLKIREVYNVACSMCRKTFKYVGEGYPAHSVRCPSCSAISEERPLTGSLGHPDEHKHHQDILEDPFAHNEFVRIRNSR